MVPWVAVHGQCDHWFNCHPLRAMVDISRGAIIQKPGWERVRILYNDYHTYLR
jgi:hypothetical protein